MKLQGGQQTLNYLIQPPILKPLLCSGFLNTALNSIAEATETLPANVYRGLSLLCFFSDSTRPTYLPTKYAVNATMIEN